MMERLEDELRRAMRREEPPPGFAGRVLARAAEQPRQPRWLESLRNLLRARSAGWAVAGALAVILALGAAFHVRRERELRARGEEARAQLMMALRIAGSKLNYAQAKVLEIGREAPREQRLVKQ